MICEQETKYKKRERKRDKREQERKIEIDSCKKSPNFGLCTCAKKQK